MKLLQSLERSRGFWFIFTVAVLFFLLRFPSLFEPYWYGDEGIYHVLGNAIDNGRTLYSQAWDNKPPLLYVLYSIFNSDQFLIRFVSMVFGILSIIVFYLLSRRLFERNISSYVSTCLFALLFGLPILEGNIANAENFMIFPILLSGFLVFKFTEQKKRNYSLLLWAGTLLGIAFLFKIVAFFDFLAFFLFLVFIERKLDKKMLINFIIGFSAPIILTTAFFFLRGAFYPYISAVLFSNISYVGHGNKLFFLSQGLLFIKSIILFFSVVFLYVRRDKISKVSLFIFVWLIFSLFNAFFSQRPYTHYLLVLISSLSLLVGLLYEDKKIRRFNLFLLFVTLILVFANFSFYGKTVFYYQNFISFVTDKKTLYSYQRFFDRKTPTDYELAMYIRLNTKPEDSIFIWGNNAQVYSLSNKLPPGRYAVAYHITGSKEGVSETQRDIEKTKPKLVIVMPYMKDFPFSLTNYVQKKTIDDVLIYERL